MCISEKKTILIGMWKTWKTSVQVLKTDQLHTFVGILQIINTESSVEKYISAGVYTDILAGYIHIFVHIGATFPWIISVSKCCFLA